MADYGFREPQSWRPLTKLQPRPTHRIQSLCAEPNTNNQQSTLVMPHFKTPGQPNAASDESNKNQAKGTSCMPERLADKETSAQNPRYLSSATLRPEDYRKTRHAGTLSCSYL